MADKDDHLIDIDQERDRFVEYWTYRFREMIMDGHWNSEEFIGLEGGVLDDLMGQYIDIHEYRLWTDTKYHLSDNKARRVRSIEHLQIDVDRDTWRRVIDALAQAGINAVHRHFKDFAEGEGEAGDYHLARIGGIGHYPRVLHDVVFSADRGQEKLASEYAACKTKMYELKHVIVQRQEDGTFVNWDGKDVYSL